MLEEFDRDVLVDRVAIGEQQRHLEHVEAVFRHPGRAVRLFQDFAAGSITERSNGPILSSPRKPPSKMLSPRASSRLTHQVKLISSLLKTRARKSKSVAAVDAEHRQRRPCLNRRVHVAEIPFVGRQLAVRMHVPFARQQQQLVLRHRRVGMGENDAVKGEVPRGVPRILPLIRHRDDVVVAEVAPSRVAAGFPRSGGRHLVALEPARNVVVIELQAPDHSREGLPHHHRFFVGRALRA